MKSIPKHLILAIVLFVLAALIGGGLWFWTGGTLETSLEEKRQLEMQIQSVSKKGIFPNRANLEKIQKSTEEIYTLLKPVEESVQKTSDVFDLIRGSKDKEGNRSGLSANDWKRMLGEKRDELIELASANNVALPEVFYLGFERYRALTPAEDATYDLGVQLLAMSKILEMAFDSGVIELQEINRVYVEDKQVGLATEGLSAEIAKGPKDWYTIYPFEIKYIGTADSVTRLTNKIAKAPYYFILRLVDVENEKTSVPRKSEVISQAEGEGAQKNIIPIVGQELIKVAMRIDLILWDSSNEPAAETEEKK